ncbi:MAG: hypothetical protein L0Y72_02430 [Gemmataceae bacterium]|nr:hypothetical protein [Gemmataceae bacterium]MCI0737873.1 hypothetical protein [Gemmataceae bacterium]
MTRIARVSDNGRNDFPSIQLVLELRDPLLVAYFESFAEPERSAKALEALKVGVIALQSACPTLDTQIIKDQFAEMQEDFGKALAHFFAEKDGIVPKSLNDAFGDKGVLVQFFQRYFDPETGRLVRLMDGQVGPSSKFAKLFDPKNKDGVIAMIEDKVKQLVEAKLNEVLKEFSLDEDGSALSRLKTMFNSAFSGLREGLGIKVARAEEAERGHVKGFSIEEDLYEVVAETGRHYGDETELVRGTLGILKCKTGDHLVTLGETTGAPGQRIVVEVKDQDYKAKKAIAELQEAKKNRGAVSGIFVFAKGCEPTEFGNFKRIDNDFYITVDKSALAEGEPLPFLWAAYEIARVQAVVAIRKEAGGKFDLERIQLHIDGIAAWVPRLGEIITKANTVQKSGNCIETAAKEIKEDIERRVKDVLALLRLDPE